MTNLEAILKERGISMYKVCNIIGKSSTGFSSYLKQQIAGEKPMDYNSYKLLLSYLNLTEKEIPFSIVKIRIK